MTAGAKIPNNFSFAEQSAVPKIETKNQNKLLVFRKQKFLSILIGEKQLCVCNEIISFEDVIVCKDIDEVIAILPKKDFSCALSTKMFAE